MCKVTVEALRSILDEKLAPLKTENAELRQFIDCTSKKYDEVMTKLKEQETLNKAITKAPQGVNGDFLYLLECLVLFVSSSGMFPGMV